MFFLTDLKHSLGRYELPQKKIGPIGLAFIVYKQTNKQANVCVG